MRDDYLFEGWMKDEIRCGHVIADHVRHELPEVCIIECSRCGATWEKGAERIVTPPIFMLAA